MAAARVTLNLAQNSKFKEQVEGATAKKVAKVLDSMADEIVIEANAQIDKVFVTDRNTDRRRNRTRHLKGSIRVEVDDDNGFPMALGVFSSAPKAKVNALNSGSRAHWIRAVNADRLAFPSTKTMSVDYVIRDGRASQVRTETRTKRPTSRAREQAYFSGKGKKLARPEEVWHPGTKAYGFLDKATEIVVRRRLSGQRL